MSLVGLRQDATREFQSDLDKGKGTPEATVFTLGTLTARVQVYLRDQATKFKPDPENPGEVVAEFLPNHSAFETVRFGLKGWANFKDDEGKDVPFNTENQKLGGRDHMVVDEDSMDFLHGDVIRELAEALNEINTLSEKEVKNSEG
jgi:hypothetical protein